MRQNLTQQQNETIASEVQAYLQTVDDLESMKYKTVLRMLEEKLSISRGSLDEHKEMIKSIIKDETLSEFQNRTNKAREDDQLASQLYSNEDYSNLLEQPIETYDQRQLYNAFIYFSREKRGNMQGQQAGLSALEVIKLIEEAWRMLPIEEKQRYVKLSDSDHSRFARELQERNPNIYIRARKDRDFFRKERDVSNRRISVNNSTAQIPKKARSAYIFYCLQHRTRIQEQNESISPVEVSRRLGTEWNSLSSTEKDPYKKREDEDRIRYLRDLSDQGITPEDVKRCSRNSSASASRAKSAYLYFCSLKREELRTQNSQLSSNDMNKHMNSIWSSMSDEERSPYEESAFDDKERIKREVEKVRRSIKQPIILPIPKQKRVRRARTPYTLFYKEQMAEIKEKNGNMPFGEISRKLADVWKSLPDDRKQIYVDRSHQEQQLYNPPAVSFSNEDERKDVENDRMNIGFRFFYEQRYVIIKEEAPDLGDDVIHQKISIEWASLDEVTRNTLMKQEIALEKGEYIGYDDEVK